MKNYLLFTFTLLLSISSFSQIHEETKHLKCAHSHKHYDLKVSENLTKYDVKFYYLDIEASNESSAVNGFTKILATATQDINTFAIELGNELNVDSVLINNQKKNFTHANNEISVGLSTTIEANQDFTAQVFYKRTASVSTDGIYCLPVIGWQKVTHTLSEPYHAKNWFACKQDLHDKADSVWVFVTVNNNLKAGSNGLLTKVTDMGNNKDRYEWKSNYPIAYYLISIAVADYTDYSFYAKPEALNGDSILVQNYLYNNYSGLNEQKAGMDVTSEMLDVFSDKYSLYPFWEEKYGHCYSPMYAGAMEHQTMTTTSSHAFYIIAHELGHQWFGDNVTCASWQDIWINEGFASYSEYLAYENLLSASETKQYLLTAQAYARQAPFGSLYVPFEELNNEGRIFSWSLTYRKGLCMVHMIRSEINNDELFFENLRGFQAEFKDGVATGDDFRDYLNNNTDIDFTNFFNEWYYGEGYPTYHVNWSQNNGKLSLKIDQNTTASTVTPFFTNAIELKVTHLLGDTLIRVKPTANNQTFAVDFESQITSIAIDPKSNILSGENTITHEVSIRDEKQLNIEIYPNPVKNELRISSDQPINNIEIYDASGKLLLADKLKKKKTTIDTKKWNHGIYLVKIYSDSKTVSHRILKN